MHLTRKEKNRCHEGFAPLTIALTSFLNNVRSSQRHGFIRVKLVSPWQQVQASEMSDEADAVVEGSDVPRDGEVTGISATGATQPSNMDTW